MCIRRSANSDPKVPGRDGREPGATNDIRQRQIDHASGVVEPAHLHVATGENHILFVKEEVVTLPEAIHAFHDTSRPPGAGACRP